MSQNKAFKKGIIGVRKTRTLLEESGSTKAAATADTWLKDWPCNTAVSAAAATTDNWLKDWPC
jgi:hypothetical protein